MGVFDSKPVALQAREADSTGAATAKEEEEAKGVTAERQAQGAAGRGQVRQIFKQLSLDTLDDDARSGCDPMAGLTTPRQLGGFEALPFGDGEVRPSEAVQMDKGGARSPAISASS